MTHGVDFLLFLYLIIEIHIALIKQPMNLTTMILATMTLNISVIKLMFMENYDASWSEELNQYLYQYIGDMYWKVTIYLNI